eukprot:7273419-Alexandrium_andersonii.AAC.1
MEQPSRTGSRPPAALQRSGASGRASRWPTPTRINGASRGTSSARCSSSAPGPASWPTVGRRRSAGA